MPYSRGPWKVGQGGDLHWRVYTRGGTIICQFGDGQDEEYKDPHNAEANAHLVALAPMLFEELTRLAGAVEELGCTCASTHPAPGCSGLKYTKAARRLLAKGPQ